jgi:hypothetical protein
LQTKSLLVTYVTLFDLVENIFHVFETCQSNNNMIKVIFQHEEFRINMFFHQKDCRPHLSLLVRVGMKEESVILVFCLTVIRMYYSPVI